jgi:hypothetical protein
MALSVSPGRCVFGCSGRGAGDERSRAAMGRFEDRLWSDLVQEHGVELAVAQWRAPQGHRTRPVLLTGGALGVVRAATALALTLAASSSTPAFAVTDNSDANRHGDNPRHCQRDRRQFPKLARLEVGARAVPAVSGCTATVRPEPEYHSVGALRADPHSSAVTIKPSAIPQSARVGRQGDQHESCRAWRDAGSWSRTSLFR